MGLINYFLADSRLKKGIKTAKQAKASSGEAADKLFSSTYQAYASVMENNAALKKGFYWWGLALYDQAATKTGPEAEKLYCEASEKYSAAMIVDPGNSHIANDWGAAIMAQAREIGANPDDALYNQAQQKFQLAGNLRTGLGTFNLACIHSLRGEYDDCKNQLEIARDSQTLPAMSEVRDDTDLANVATLDWFKEFIDANPEPDEATDTNGKSETS